MSEQTIWRGCSSQVKNFWPFVSCLLLVPIPWAIYRWLVVKTTKFELTSERLITTTGIFGMTTESLELYRVQDLAVTQSFSQRLLGLQTVELVTGDATSPRIAIDYVPVDLKLQDTIRRQVEECRMRKRVMTVDSEHAPDLSSHPGDASN